MSAINVLLAEDHAIVRDGLRVLLDLEKDLHVVAEASDGHQAVDLAEKLRPDVIVMDVAMPVLNGLEATRQILRHRPETKIIILSAHNDDAYVKQALAFGASGYLLKQIAANMLPRAIREVHRGTPCFSPEISGASSIIATGLAPSVIRFPRGGLPSSVRVKWRCSS